MKEIKLSKSTKATKNRGKYVALVDDEDYEELIKYSWSAVVKPHTVYACRTYWDESKRSIRVLLHRHIMGLPITMEDGLMVDHIDGNGLNNQKSNLRLCSSAQNIQNSKPRKNKSSQYKGVWWNKHADRWAAECCCLDKRGHLGYFGSEIEAAKAYDAKAKELQGVFAKLNFPD